MKKLLILLILAFSGSVFANDYAINSSELKVTRPMTQTEVQISGLSTRLVSVPGVWETTTGRQTCPNGTSASDSCNWYNPGGGATCTGGCSPSAWETCRCW